MSTLKQRFAELKSEKPEIAQADIARATKAKPPSVNAWFNGKTKSMKLATATAAASLYGVMPLWLAEGTGNKYPESQPKEIEQSGAKTIERRQRVGLSATLENLSAYLEHLDDDDRAEAVRQIAGLASKPGRHAKVAASIEAMTATAFAKPSRKAA